MMKKVLITGAFGFVGFNLAAYLAGKGYELWALDVGNAQAADDYCNHSVVAMTRLKGEPHAGRQKNAWEKGWLPGRGVLTSNLRPLGGLKKVVTMPRLKGRWFGLRPASEATLNLKPSNQARSADSNQQQSCGSNQARSADSNQQQSCGSNQARSADSNQAGRPDETSPAGADQTSGDSRGAYERVFTWEQLEEIPWSEVGVVVHLAGKAHDTRSVSDVQSYFDVNVGLTKRVLEKFSRKGAKAQREEDETAEKNESAADAAGFSGASRGLKGLDGDGYCDHSVVAIPRLKGQQAESSGCITGEATVNLKPSNQPRRGGSNQAVRSAQTSPAGAAQIRCAAPAQTFILFSSVKAVADSVAGVLTEEAEPQPQTPYGRSKLEAEGILQPQSGCNDEVKGDAEHERGACGALEGEGDYCNHQVVAMTRLKGETRAERQKDAGEKGRLPGREVLNSNLRPLGGLKNGGSENSGSQVRSYILRPCMIHGPGNKGNLNLLHSVVSKGVPWPLGAFENQRSFASIGNVCAVVEGLISGAVAPGAYQVADDEALSTNELIRLIAESQGRRPRLWRIPKGAVVWTAKVGDWLHLPLNSERLRKLTESYVVSNAKVKRALGWERMPVEAKEGMRQTLESFSR